MRLDWTPHGDAPVRLDQDPRWILLGLAGHGAPDTTLQTAGSHGRDERTPLHAPAQPRLLTLHLQIRGDTLADYETHRATLAAAFAPWRDTGLRAQPGLLTATLADGRVRALRAFPRQDLAWGAGRQRGAQTRESISLEAPDPFWFDPTLVTGQFPLAGPGALRFNATTELGFPTAFGSDLPSVRALISNPGSVRSFPILLLPGPSLDPQFRIGATGHQLDFALTVPAGLSLRVCCGAQPDGSADAPAAHLIDDLGGATTVLGALRSGSRFWALGPGDNVVTVAQRGPAPGPGAPATTVQISYFPRHVAI